LNRELVLGGIYRSENPDVSRVFHPGLRQPFNGKSEITSLGLLRRVVCPTTVVNLPEVVQFIQKNQKLVQRPLFPGAMSRINVMMDHPLPFTLFTRVGCPIPVLM
jgi:hypothetical protein